MPWESELKILDLVDFRIALRTRNRPVSFTDLRMGHRNVLRSDLGCRSCTNTYSGAQYPPGSGCADLSNAQSRSRGVIDRATFWAKCSLLRVMQPTARRILAKPLKCVTPPVLSNPTNLQSCCHGADTSSSSVEGVQAAICATEAVSKVAIQSSAM